MPNEKVTFHQAIYTMIMFGFGSSSIMGVSTGIHQDVWVSILLGALFFIPLMLVYGRIIKLFPEKNLFQVMEITLGKVAGKIFTVLMVWYSVHLAALVLHNFGDFIEVFDMPETPQLAIMILMFLITVYLARSGILVVGKWSVITLFFIFLVMVFTAIASVTQLDPLNLFPLFEATFPEIIEDSFVIFSFPFAESVIFLCLADSFYKQDNVYKIFFYSLAILVGIFLVIFFRNLFLLGNAMNDISYYPSYTAVRTIEIGDYFARMESSISPTLSIRALSKSRRASSPPARESPACLKRPALRFISCRWGCAAWLLLLFSIPAPWRCLRLWRIIPITRFRFR